MFSLENKFKLDVKMNRLHAIVFFDSTEKRPLDYKVYTVGKKFISEFIDFGLKTLIHKMDFTNPEFAIELANREFIVYITIVDGVGCVLLVSKPSAQLNDLPHLVSRKLINDYVNYNVIPEAEDIISYFKHKELLEQVNETKKILTRTISKVLERGEKIEELVAKTENLSGSSKLFFHHSRKMNSCWGCIPRPSWWL